MLSDIFDAAAAIFRHCAAAFAADATTFFAIFAFRRFFHAFSRFFRLRRCLLRLDLLSPTPAFRRRHCFHACHYFADFADYAADADFRRAALRKARDLPRRYAMMRFDMRR